MSEFSKALVRGNQRLAGPSACGLRHLSENISQTLTRPAIAARPLQFQTEFGAGQGVALQSKPARCLLDRTDLERIFDPSHPMADGTGHYEGSNVNLLIELTDAREAQRSYEANLKMFEQTRKMSSGLMDLLRR